MKHNPFSLRSLLVAVLVLNLFTTVAQAADPRVDIKQSESTNEKPVNAAGKSAWLDFLQQEVGAYLNRLDRDRHSRDILDSWTVDQQLQTLVEFPSTGRASLNDTNVENDALYSVLPKDMTLRVALPLQAEFPTEGTFSSVEYRASQSYDDISPPSIDGVYVFPGDDFTPFMQPSK